VRLSLHMMVLNGAGVLDRALRPLGGIADEVVFVDTGSTDGTPEKIASIARDLGMACRAILMSPATHPGDYFLDDQSSFRTKMPADFFSGVWIPRDWSLCRNRSLDACSGEYVMKLDADDEVMMPENIIPTLAHLDARPDIDIVMSTYEVMTRAPGSGDSVREHTSMYTRLWRRLPRIRFAEVCHENVDHARNPDGSNWLMAPSGLVVRDWRDSMGAGVRPAHRNLKVLLLEFERLTALGIRPGRHLLMYLADEAAPVMPNLSIGVLGLVRELSPADATWACLIRGQAFMHLGHLREAAREYEFAAQQGSPRAELLLGMVEHDLGRSGWEHRLSSAIPRCQQKLWPHGASNPEVAAAQKLLQTVTDPTLCDPDVVMIESD